MRIKRGFPRFVEENHLFTFSVHKSAKIMQIMVARKAGITAILYRRSTLVIRSIIQVDNGCKTVLTYVIYNLMK